MKVLFIGGTGIISSACARVAVERGVEVYLLNRGQTAHWPVPEGARAIHGDIRDPGSVKRALGDQKFDVVADFGAFTPDHVQADIDLFRGRVGLYVFVSSAGVYQKPLRSLPITESTPLGNPRWLYARQKAACEDLLIRSYRETGFPVTIVRPSHTYDRTTLPFEGGYTVIDRMRRGEKVAQPDL